MRYDKGLRMDSRDGRRLADFPRKGFWRKKFILTPEEITLVSDDTLMTLLVAHLVPLTPEEAKATIVNFVNKDLDTMMQIEGNKNMEDKAFLKKHTLKAIDLAKYATSDAEAIRQLGEGWTAEEAWAISLYCAIRHIDSMEDAIIAAVNHDGDSDSTGSITGNIMGYCTKIEIPDLSQPELVEYLLKRFDYDEDICYSLKIYSDKVSVARDERCQYCGGTPVNLYYRNGPVAWVLLAGREGDLTVCPECGQWNHYHWFGMS